MPDFFKEPVLNSPYEYPARHWELDEDGQPTNRIIPQRRKCDLITPVPKPRRRRRGQLQAMRPAIETGKPRYLPLGRRGVIRGRVVLVIGQRR